MEIFIGSSRESRDLARDIAIWLEERNHDALPWDQPGLFPPGEQTMKVLIDISRRVEAAILVFGADDQVWYRGDSVQQPRDNVLIEYGLFACALGLGRAIICLNGDIKHPADLTNLSCIDLSPRVRDHGKRALSLWAQRLTSGLTVDPALLRLQARVATLKEENEQLNERLKFEAVKSQDLSDLLSEANVADFSRYDLEQDGHWKLLFDYTYFHEVAATVASYAHYPIDLHQLFNNAGARDLADQVAWHNPGDPRHSTPDEGATRTEFLARKVLRLFRRNAREAESYQEFITEVPPELHEAINEVGRKAVERLRAT
ncbi:MAG TPA: TIR domain-containing protein [Actinophytocola sp.]|jgi:hypothetical protein|uniref:TIR domain-containing protein n=1 Tax=Actinophytocola sp. TaxID=1872138 RepID=UPI002E04124E|nr:TIR domain-containing protein [Actinophytocola sp.]